MNWDIKKSPTNTEERKLWWDANYERMAKELSDEVDVKFLKMCGDVLTEELIKHEKKKEGI